MRWGPLLVVVLLSMVTLQVQTGSFGVQDDVPVARVNHSPITINGNSDLQSRANNEGWSGSGAINDPYIITNYRILATGQHCISISNVDLYLTVRDNNLTGAMKAGVGIYYCQNIRITENLIGDNDGDGVRLEDSSNIRVDNNTLDIPLDLVINYNGIHLIRSDENYIETNGIHKSVNDAIRIGEGSNHNLITGNIIIQNRNNGINLEGDDNTVFNNHILYDNPVGVMVDSSNNLIVQNKFRLNSRGVVLHSEGSNIVRNNNFERNTFGIEVFTSNDNQIYSNYILKSDKYGIKIDHASANGNRIYDNSFFYNNNTQGYFVSSRRQAKDISGDNTWNDALNRGNYWYDLHQPDSDGDGIVDQRYFLEGGEDWDHYPLADSPIPDVFHPPQKLTAQPGNDHINLTWQGWNYGKGVRVDHFNIYKNEREGGEFLIAKTSSNDLSFTDRDVVPGRSYYYYVTAVTPIAESNRSNRVKSSPDTRAPTIQIRSPDDDSVHNSADVYVDWIGNDNIAIDRYEVKLDGEDTINADLNEFYLFLGLDEGEHTVEVRVFDMAEHNRSDTVTFTIDTIPPQVSFTGGEQGLLLFNTDSPTLSWTGVDIGPGIKGYEISFDGNNWTRLGNIEEHIFQGISEGVHSVEIRCYDMGGNWANDTVDIIIDLTEPTLYFLEPLGPGFYSTDRIDVRYNASDDLTNVKEYFLRVDTGEWFSMGLEREYSFRYLGEGIHHIYVKAVDGSGNEIIVSQTGTIDLTAPQLQVFNLVEGSLYNGPVSLEWNTIDPLSGVAYTRISVDGGDWRIFETARALEIGFAEDGDHYTIIEVFDNAGNSRAVNISFSFDVSPPMIIIAEPRNNDVPIDSVIVVAFSEQMDRSTIVIEAPGIEGDLSWDGDNLTLTPSSHLEYSKKYSIAIRGKDIAGNDVVPYNWYFFTEEDLSLHYGKVFGRVITTNGQPIPYASYRFKTGERGNCDEEGRFDLYVETGPNFIIISNNSFHELKIDFEVYKGEQEDLGSIPLKSEKEYIEDENERSSPTLLIVGIIALILLIMVIGAVVAFQVKKTKDYNKMGPVVDEWINVNDLKPPPRAPAPEPGKASTTISEEGIKR